MAGFFFKFWNFVLYVPKEKFLSICTFSKARILPTDSSFVFFDEEQLTVDWSAATISCVSL